MRFDGEILLHHRRDGGFGHGKALKTQKCYCNKRPSENLNKLSDGLLCMPNKINHKRK
ncbi:hypothetical protein NEISUBOT_05569 [Neisseria subflava NJ9703]|uniref:Uncharacterized protein n=1 Tax=Neisseria subflava NJ9703 TaxID=546268 RepID=A0A9W5MY60_NEISU|nr:hypothetical protein NEISUBOT_05569 [Neisseria subflava NJ9703]